VGLVAAFVVLWNKSESFRNFWINLWEKIKTGVSDAVKGIGKFFKETIPNLFNSLVSKVKSIGGDIVSGLWNGISNKVTWLKNKIKGFGESVLGGIKSFFGINSPSKLMRDEVGKWIPEGIAVGIDKNAKSVMSSMKDLTMDTVGAARNGLSTNVGGNGLTGGVVNNFTQVINSPKQLNRLDIYRQSKNLLGYAGGGY
jgi:phage-related protein